jgi:hypothetical protein
MGNIRLRVPTLSRRTTVVCGFVLLAIIAGGLLLVTSKSSNKSGTSEKIYGSIDGFVVKESDVLPITQQLPEQSKSGVTQILLDNAFYKKVAKDLGVGLTKEQNDQLSITNAKNYTDAQKKVFIPTTENEFLKQELRLSLIELVSGKYIIANFQTHIENETSGRAPGDEKLTEAQVQALIDKEKTYAKNFIDALYADIKSNKITFDQAIQNEINDLLIGKKIAPSNPHSGSFSTAASESDLFVGATKDKLFSLPLNQVSEPFEGLVTTDNAGKKTTPGFWVIALPLKQQKKSGTYQDFDSLVKDYKNKYHYEIKI